MKKFMKVLGILVAVFAVLLLLCYINHRVQSKKEEELLKPLGKMVQVNQNEMSVYTEGDGDKTLVFMSGGGTCSPILDFKSLYSLLSDEYKVVVVEKFGYGFSDIVDEERDIDTILTETRTALQEAGIDGPYVLCPHSMSGIEALYWAQSYPDEVDAIIGLDMAVPESYENYKINMAGIKLGQFAAKTGITRMIPGIAESDAIKFGTLSDKEKEIYRAVFYHRTATETMIDEVVDIKENAKKVSEGEMPDIPVLMFCSNGKGTGWDEDIWRSIQQNFADSCENAKMVELDCGHYVHDYEYERIADEIKEFID